jgi:hypothetical protein
LDLLISAIILTHNSQNRMKVIFSDQFSGLVMGGEIFTDGGW